MLRIYNQNIIVAHFVDSLPYFHETAQDFGDGYGFVVDIDSGKPGK